MKILVFSVALLAHTGFAQGTGAPAPPPIYRDPKAPVEARVADLLGRMTLQEKITMLSGAGNMKTPGVPRLGIPPFKMSDGPMGTRNYGPSTAYPNGVILAATWNVSQALKAGEAAGRDARARDVNILLAPGMNLYRAPMCGRNFEYLGEDPLVAGAMASAFIRGVQSQGVAATAKHLAGNEQDYNRHNLDTEVDERTLRELYLKPFAMAVKSGVCCVMDSYNPLNGVHSTQNGWLNNVMLKGEMGFNGMVMSDWGSCYNTLGMANGGLDLEMPGGRYFNEKMLMPLLAGRQVKAETIDDKVRRQLRVAVRMGWLDRPQLDASIPRDDPQNAKVALAGAREGIVLLKNAGNLLPLDPAKVRKIVVIGRNADPAVVGGAGSAFVKPFHSVSALAGLKKAAGRAEVLRVPWQPGQDSVPPEFADQVRQADAVIVCVGFNDQQDHGAHPGLPESEGEGADRLYALPFGEPSLIASAAALNAKTIVILNAGGSVETKDWIGDAPVLLDAFYPGQEGGTAIGEIIFGQTDPSGKLPFSWEKQWEDSAAYGNYPTPQNPGANSYKEGVFLGYRWFDAKGTEPLFPFGFGLGYTTFAMSNATVAKDANQDIEVTATIRNTGNRAGADVVQVYIEPPKADVPRPVRELKAFLKIALAPGESKTVTMPILRSDLAYWDPGLNDWVITPRGYMARIGDSSRNLPLAAAFSIR
jgi:beta-glucosidase